MRRKLQIVMAGLLTAIGLVVVIPSVSALPPVKSSVSADARDRAQLKAGLQRSWAKTTATSRYKACWMWFNRPDVVQSGLLASFQSTGFSASDIYSVARSHFNSVC